MPFREKIFSIGSDQEFNALALEIFNYQYWNNIVYHEFVDALHVDPVSVDHVEKIPCLPVSFFKTRQIVTGEFEPGHVFYSSGTTGMTRSRHHIADLTVYEQSILRCFHLFYGNPSGYRILGLVPGVQENPHSSLGYMVNILMKAAHPNENDFFLDEPESLHNKLLSYKSGGKKILLIGLTGALVDFAERFPQGYPGMIVMETGGMKGKGKELVREELHSLLSERLSVRVIHSEYGMTELLSQAYSKGDGVFASPSWMKVLVRDAADPLTLQKKGKTGGLNIIDLANFNSCSFIATQDLGRLHGDSGFEVLGRFDHSELRGCNLLVV